MPGSLNLFASHGTRLGEGLESSLAGSSLEASGSATLRDGLVGYAAIITGGIADAGDTPDRENSLVSV